MLLSYFVSALLAGLIPLVASSAPTDEYSDADPAQSGYLPNHNMDPAVVDSAQFGQLWKIPFNSLEKVNTIFRSRTTLYVLDFVSQVVI